MKAYESFIDIKVLIAQWCDVDDVAIRQGKKQLTYHELAIEVNKMKAWLTDNNVRCLAFEGGHSIAWVVIDLACQLANVAFLPLPSFFTQLQKSHSYGQVIPDVILKEQSDLETNKQQQLCIGIGKFSITTIAVSSVVLNYPRGTSKITYTSGSTGTPKGVCLSARQQWVVAQSLVDATGVKTKNKHLSLLPFSVLLENIGGIYATLLNQGTVIMPDEKEQPLLGSSQLDVQALAELITKSQPQTMILIPQLLTALLALIDSGWKAPGSLEFIAVGGAKVSPKLLSAAHDAGLPVYEGYGLSECCSVVALNTPQAHRSNSVGRPLPHVSVSIVEGDLVVKGCNFLGYVFEPTSWYPKDIKTGDLAQLNDGFLQLSGRKKNLLINSFGRNVSPEWPESEALAHLQIKHCMLVGDGQPFFSILYSTHNNQPLQSEQLWLDTINSSLPDYAKIQQAHWLKQARFSPVLTANGRLQRQKALEAFQPELDRIYFSQFTESTFTGEVI